MENYNNDKNTYITRMNKTALSKFDVLKPYLKKKTKVLDYGSGISPEFIKNNKIFNKKIYKPEMLSAKTDRFVDDLSGFYGNCG